MICKNCGAKISDATLLCPYCDTENEKVAKKQQEDYVNYYEQKKEGLKKTPEKVVKNTAKILLYVTAGLLIAFVLIFIVIYAFSKVTDADMLAQQEEELEILEGYYQAGDYDNMCKYLDLFRKNGGSYEKYIRISELYEGMDWRIELLKNNYEDVGVKELNAVYVESDFECCIKVLAQIAEMEEYNFPYNEETGALYVKEQYMNALKQYMFLTDEEIESAVSIYNEDENDYMELAEIAISRMEESIQ